LEKLDVEATKEVVAGGEDLANEAASAAQAIKIAEDCIFTWEKLCAEQKIHVSAVFSLIETLGDPVKIQLHRIVAAKEEPELEEQRTQLVIQGVSKKNLLKSIEDRTVEELSSSEGNILEDETAVEILSSSKELSADIDENRGRNRPVALHSSTLLFCISVVAALDSMYQYSLAWFVSLYSSFIQNAMVNAMELYQGLEL
jgi:hypothetical protein